VIDRGAFLREALAVARPMPALPPVTSATIAGQAEQPVRRVL
jgi:hypothetical protein